MSFMIWVLALLNFVLLGVIFFLYKSLRNNSSLVARRRRVDKLKDYLSKHLSEGVNINVLRKTILDSGWPVEIVEQSLRELGY
ncbi:hypothetical protein HY483_01860 [Candidatus Woesearchaeota archaeon]|nr:hypothetical protein [Candidatus Woesearchaeota archaeon]